METFDIGRIMKTGTSLAVVLPVHILRALNWKRGDKVIFQVFSEDAVTVHKLSDNELRSLKVIEIE